jgi:hypothetical protein
MRNGYEEFIICTRSSCSNESLIEICIKSSLFNFIQFFLMVTQLNEQAILAETLLKSKDMDFICVSLQSLSLDFGFGLDCNCLSFFMYWISIWRLMYSVIEIMINLFHLRWIHFFVENTYFFLERKSFFLKADIPCELLLLLLFVVIVVSWFL